MQQVKQASISSRPSLALSALFMQPCTVGLCRALAPCLLQLFEPKAVITRAAIKHTGFCLGQLQLLRLYITPTHRVLLGMTGRIS